MLFTECVVKYRFIVWIFLPVEDWEYVQLTMERYGFGTLVMGRLGLVYINLIYSSNSTFTQVSRTLIVLHCTIIQGCAISFDKSLVINGQVCILIFASVDLLIYKLCHKMYGQSQLKSLFAKSLIFNNVSELPAVLFHQIWHS